MSTNFSLSLWGLHWLQWFHHALGMGDKFFPSCWPRMSLLSISGDVAKYNWVTAPWIGRASVLISFNFYPPPPPVGAILIHSHRFSSIFTYSHPHSLSLSLFSSVSPSSKLSRFSCFSLLYLTFNLGRHPSELQTSQSAAKRWRGDSWAPRLPWPLAEMHNRKLWKQAGKTWPNKPKKQSTAPG